MKKTDSNMSISNCQLIGANINLDAEAVGAIKMIAEGLLENAKGLSRLAYVLSASNVHVDALIKVEGVGTRTLSPRRQARKRVKG